MFTGLIEEIGILKTKRKLGGGIKITIEAHRVMEQLNIDDSIAIDGVCLTVISKTTSTFDVEAVEETLKKTTLDIITPGTKVNLERALLPSDRLGGHIVQGHVDCVGIVESIERQSTGRLIWISYPKEYSQYIISRGSICVNGISLTVAKVELSRFMVSIIPHTWEVTNFNLIRNGSKVNIEFDIIGKYIEKIIEPWYKQGSVKTLNFDNY